MTFRKLVSLTVSVVTLAFACSKQGEGERCSFSNGNQDCDDNLTCMQPAGNTNDSCDPLSPAPQFDCKPHRCCYASGQVTDSRCEGYVAPLPGGTGGADAGTAGASTAGNTSSAGSSSTGGAGVNPATGGSVTGGGSTSTGGAPATGGIPATGGAPATGGVTSTSST